MSPSSLRRSPLPPSAQGPAYLTKLLSALIVDGIALPPASLHDMASLTTTLPSPLVVHNNHNGTTTLEAPHGTATVVGQPLYIGAAVLYRVDGLLLAALY